MTAPVDLRTSTADNVRADFRAARLLQAGRASELSERELPRIGDRIGNTLNGDSGLARTFVPMQSERCPATIYRLLQRNDTIVSLAQMHFRREPELAAEGVRTVLIKYRRSAKRDPCSICALYFEHESEVIGREAIRKVLEAAGFYNPLI
jgi:hypothetical protein